MQAGLRSNVMINISLYSAGSRDREPEDSLPSLKKLHHWALSWATSIHWNFLKRIFFKTSTNA
jgi:hypothetical protein